VGTGKALNSLSWAPSGKKIICGDATGSVYVYDISEVPIHLSLSLSSVRHVRVCMCGSPV
jgi:WD40 repeat protein